MSAIEALLIIAACGVIGGVANVFNSDGFHLPRFEHGVWVPGYLATVFVGAIAAAAAWSVTRTEVITSLLEGTSRLQLKDLSYGIVIGFSGAKWLSAEWEKHVWKKAAIVAAAKGPDPNAAQAIATSTPRDALRIVAQMK